MDHAPGFLAMVDEARPRVREVDVEQTKEKVGAGPQVALIDVREDHEWNQGHAEEAMHLGRGVLERDLERLVPNKDRELILYCGGGYRSILAADAAQKMGYEKVYSLKGGYKALLEAAWPMKREG